jgi:hypothetical protein
MKTLALFSGLSACVVGLGALLFSCGGEDRHPLQSVVDASLDGISPFADGGDSGGLKPTPPDPKTCAEAADQQSYVGCDYWPTITSNPVANVFDFAVAIANIGTDVVNVTVTGNGVNKQVAVNPNTVGTIYLPWVAPLKGGEDNSLEESVLVRKGAYHLVADKPVVVYQFSPLEFKAAGGEPGKDWSACKPLPPATECYSYTNDASLLLPSTAMTGAYRVMGDVGNSSHPINPNTGQFDTTRPLQAVTAPAMTITATADNTTVQIKLGQRATVVGTGALDAGTDASSEGGADASSDAGADAAVDASADAGVDAASDAGVDSGGYDLGVVPSAGPGGTLTLTLNAGDVAQLVAGLGQVFDFSGSVVIADKPIQVIASNPCQYHPIDTYACDHEEETVFPAETLGKHYVVTMPSGPKTTPVSHLVRFYGNVDGTILEYKLQKPTGCPTIINAGEVVDCAIVVSNFEVSGNNPFGVGLFMLGGQMVDPAGYAAGISQGDPSQSLAVAVEQYRQKYVFLAPADYKTNFVDIISGADTKLTLDGNDVSGSLQPITGTAFFVGRVQLQPINGGVHTLTATRPVGIQVLGYGDYTSFQYPGGLNLAKIAEPPK